MRITTIAGIILIAALIGYGGASADVAHLRNGESLRVSGFRLDGNLVYLTMEGDGEVALPSSEVLEIRRMVPKEREDLPEISHRAVSAEQVTPAASPVGESPDEFPPGAVFDHEALRRLAARVALKHGIDAALVQAVVQVESRYDAFAVSPRGAMGLMQLMPKTAARFNVSNAFNPLENLNGGVQYLKELLERYSGETQLALAAYNAGEIAVERYGGVPPYRETKNYVSRVMAAAAR